jgi:hypothetical protein
MTTPAIPKIENNFLSNPDDEPTSEWVYEHHHILNEKGQKITFETHQFLIDIYNDQKDNIVVMKAAQIGMSTLEILKNIKDAETKKMDIIYTLPSDADVGVFVSGKVNRIIANNPHLEGLTVDKDSIEQKQIKNSMIYFRGTWTKKAAIMVTADRLVHDEKDSSKQDVIADYQARLQHSRFKQTHVFSHPSVPGSGVDSEWQLSDQKEWFIKCPHCEKRQFLEWNIEEEKHMSVDIVKKEFICKHCHGVLDWHARAKGRWWPRKGKENAKWSGYHISLLMAPWVTADDVIQKYNEVTAGKQTMDYFYNKVLGLPYAGSGNSVPQESILGAVTEDKNLYQGRLVIGVDTGVHLRYVIGNKQGLIGYGQMEDYSPDESNKLQLRETLEYFLKSFPASIMVIDQGGDIIGSRKLKKKYPGRVFLCHYARDRKTMQLIRWGDKDEFGNVVVDRNRMMQLVIDEFREKRLKLYNGTQADWYDYWLHFSHIYRVWEKDSMDIDRYVWMRSDRDDWVHATVYWRVGIDRFGDSGGIVGVSPSLQPDSYVINPDQTVDFDPHSMFGKGMKKEGPSEDEDPWWSKEQEPDWRG